MLKDSKVPFNKARIEELQMFVMDKFANQQGYRGGQSKGQTVLRYSWWYDLGVYGASQEEGYIRGLGLGENVFKNIHTPQTLTRWLVDDAVENLSSWAQDSRSFDITSIKVRDDATQRIDEFGNILPPPDFSKWNEHDKQKLEDELRECLTARQIKKYWKDLLLEGIVSLHYSKEYGTLTACGEDVYYDDMMGLLVFRSMLAEDPLSPEQESDEQYVYFINYQDDNDQWWSFHFEDANGSVEGEVSKAIPVARPNIFIHCYTQTMECEAIGVPRIIDPLERDNVILQQAIHSRFVKTLGKTTIIPTRLVQGSSQGEDLDKGKYVPINGLSAQNIVTLPTYTEDLQYLEERERTLKAQAKELTGLNTVSFDEIQTGQAKTALEVGTVESKQMARVKALHTEFIRCFMGFMKDVCYHKYEIEIETNVALSPLDDKKRIQGIQATSLIMKDLMAVDPKGRLTGMRTGLVYREMLGQIASSFCMDKSIFDKAFDNITEDEYVREQDAMMEKAKQAQEYLPTRIAADAQKMEAQTNRFRAQTDRMKAQSESETTFGTTIRDSERLGGQDLNKQLTDYFKLRDDQGKYFLEILRVCADLRKEGTEEAIAMAQQLEQALELDAEEEIRTEGTRIGRLMAEQQRNQS